MARRKIYITEFDLARLSFMIEETSTYNNRDNEQLENLAEELDRGEIVTPQGIPPDVITMNSKVCLEDLDTGEELTYTLVFPENANITQQKISVLAPIGTALLGYRVGDTIRWKVPAGIRRLKVKQILFQPESAGNYHL